MSSELELEQWSTFAPVKPCYSATSIRIGENLNEKDVLLPSTICRGVGTEVQENSIAKMVTIKREIEDDEYLTGKLKTEAIEDLHITSPQLKVTESGPNLCLDTPRTDREFLVQPQPVIPTNDFILTEAHLISVVDDDSKETLQTENEVYDDMNRKSKYLNKVKSLFEVDETCSTEAEFNDFIDSMITLCGVNILQSVLEARPLIDTIISCADGKLGAHRIVITAASQFLGQLFADQRSEDIAVIILPNINKHTMVSLLNLAYTGRMVYKLEDQDAILDAMHCLRFGDVSKLSLYPVVTNNLPLKESKSNNTKANKTSTEASKDTVTKIHDFEQEDRSGKSSSNGSPEASKDTVTKIHDFEQEDRSGKSSSNGALSHQPKPSCSTFAESSKSTLASTNKKKIHVCPQCPRSFANKNALQLHATKFHTKNYFASIGEMQMLSFCDICDRQYKTINRATFCYAQHGLSRCLCCLGLYPTTEIKDHYQKTHASFEGNDVFVKCRWCPRTVSMKNHCANIVSHCNTHWPNPTSPKVPSPEETTPKRPTKCRKRSSNKAFRETTPSTESKIGKQKKLKANQTEAENQKDKNGGEFYIGQQSQIVSCAMDRACNNSQVGNNRKKETVIIDLHNLPKAFVKLDLIENIQMYIKPNHLIESPPLSNLKKEQEETKVNTFHDNDCNQNDDEMSSKEKEREDNIVAATSIVKNLHPMDNNVVEAQFLNGYRNNIVLIEELNQDKPGSDHEKIRNTDHTKVYPSPIIGNNHDIYNNNELKPTEKSFVTNYDFTSPTRNSSLSKIKVPLFPLSNPFAKGKQSGFTTDLNEHHGTNGSKTDNKDGLD